MSDHGHATVLGTPNLFLDVVSRLRPARFARTLFPTRLATPPPHLLAATRGGPPRRHARDRSSFSIPATSTAALRLFYPAVSGPELVETALIRRASLSKHPLIVQDGAT